MRKGEGRGHEEHGLDQEEDKEHAGSKEVENIETEEKEVGGE